MRSVLAPINFSQGQALLLANVSSTGDKLLYDVLGVQKGSKAVIVEVNKILATYLDCPGEGALLAQCQLVQTTALTAFILRRINRRKARQSLYGASRLSIPAYSGSAG